LSACGGSSPDVSESATQRIAQSSAAPADAGAVVEINLSAVANVDAIANVGLTVLNGGMDTYGYAYAANLLGSSVTWSGISFTLGSADVPDAVHGGTIAVPAGYYSSVKLLGAAVQGSHVNQMFIVNYSIESKTSLSSEFDSCEWLELTLIDIINRPTPGIRYPIVREGVVD
jgi:hypothetical protein